MSVEQLQVLHGRYANLSHHFRAAWAFNQYLESLAKLSASGARPQLPVDFQQLYGDLKGLSDRLNAVDSQRVQAELDRVERRLRELNTALLEEDSRVSPHRLRQFLQRVRNQDEKLLVQLVKFYVYSRDDGGAWPQDRFDKLDFLLTKIAEERGEGGGFQIMDRGRLRELSTGLWRALALPAPPDGLVEKALEKIREITRQLSTVDDLDGLNDRELVPRFREAKQELGLYLLEPRVLPELLATNLKFKNLIERLYSVEERRIVADYQRIFELEQEVTLDGELDEALSTFRGDIEQFEERLRNHELKLEDLAHIRSQVEVLSERLTARTEAEPGTDPGTDPGFSDAGTAPGTGPTGGGAGVMGLAEPVRAVLRRIDGALSSVAAGVPPRQAVTLPEVFPFRLEAREVIAFRRFASGAPDGADHLVRQAAAWRVLLGEMAEEMRGLQEETARTGESPIYRQARDLMDEAGTMIGRFEAEIERRLLGGDVGEARKLTLLKMRFVRDHAGCWLVAERPRLKLLGAED